MLTGKIAIITGASSGIGAAVARRLSHDGASVVLAARRKEKIDALAAALNAAGGSSLSIPTDVTSRIQAERLIAVTIERFGRLDILVNNAGRGHCANVEETTDETIRNMFEVNVFSLWYTSRPALRQMKKQGSGHIINIASMAGKLGFPYNSAYVAAKHACVGFTHALRMELTGTGIHASVVCPAGVLTDWASNTEGGSMLPLFSEAGPIAARIAEEQGVDLPAIEGPLAADAVARAIIECIHHPAAEVYTHRGSKEFVALAAMNREEAERKQMLMALAEQQVYEKLKQGQHRA